MTRYATLLRGLIGVVLGFDFFLSLLALSTVITGGGNLAPPFVVYLVVVILSPLPLKALWDSREFKELPLVSSVIAAVIIVILFVINSIWYIYTSVVAYLIHYPSSALRAAINFSLFIGTINLICFLLVIVALLWSRGKFLQKTRTIQTGYDT